MEEQLLVSRHSRDRNQLVSRTGTITWLRKALVAVVCAVLGHVPVYVLIALAVCLTAALLFVSSKDAQAEVPSLIPDGQLESPGALGVAVDQSTEASDPSRGDLYVAGLVSVVKGKESLEVLIGSVNKFDAGGNLRSPSPIGGGVYGGAAVNPVNGDVYALDAVGSAIDVFDPASGASLGAFSVEASSNLEVPFFGNFTVVEISADAEGNVYVPVVPKNEVLEYDPTTCAEEQANGEPPPCKPLKTFTGGSGAGALKRPTGVAIDSAGNLWVADTGNNRIEELSPSDKPVEGGVIPSEGVGSVAVDAHDDVFAIVSNGRDACGAIQPPCSHLVEYGANDAQVEDLGAGVIGADQFLPEEGGGRNRAPVPDMVAVSDATGEVYVSEAVLESEPGGVTGRVLKYRPPAAPTLGNESAVEVGATSAKLGTVVTPGGPSASYRFEYGTTTKYGSSAPFPEGATGAGFTAHTVWAGVSGLQPGTTYHYRAVITSPLGVTVKGEDRTFTTHTVTTCPNAAVRTGYSANLPDCRAYELVTPPNKNGAQPDKSTGSNGGNGIDLNEILEDNRAASDAEGNGNRLSFVAEDVLPGSPSMGFDYVATRGVAGWSSQNVFPSTDSYVFECGNGLHGEGHAKFSEDLSHAIVKVGSAGQPCGVDPELVPDEPHGNGLENLFLRDNATGAYQLIDVTPEGVVPATPSLLGESPDFSRIIFREEATLTPGAPAGVKDVYEWSAGHVALATVLPNGTPVAGSYVSLSPDGSRVFFTAGGNLYARVDGRETVQLDASQADGPGGGGIFAKASRDGSVLLFTDDASAGLTSDTVPGSGINLYRYDADAPADSHLTDLTPVAHAVAPAVGGISNDGSVAFFTDDASAGLTSETVPGSGTNLYRYKAAATAGFGLTDLTPAEHADVQDVLGVGEEGSAVSVYFEAGELSTGPNQHGEMPQPDQGNVYFSRGASTAFVVNGVGGSRMSPNGAFMLFESGRQLTGYDNVNPATGNPAVELYLYDAIANSLACASCNPSGAPPTANGAGVHGSGGSGGAIEEARGGGVVARQLSQTGQVFFDSAEGLLPADTNGEAGCPSVTGVPSCTDVYEFELNGVGSCAEAAGCLYLLSTGAGSLETFFIDASPSGNDVFIREFQELLPGGTEEEAPALYDVRVDGGFHERSSSPCTTPEACRTAPSSQPATSGAPASQTFSGTGNLLTPAPLTAKLPPAKCKKGYVKKKGKCVKQKPKRKRKSRKSLRSGQRRGR